MGGSYYAWNVLIGKIGEQNFVDLKEKYFYA